MGITIDHFTHSFRRAAEPSEGEARALFESLEAVNWDVWGVFPVTRGVINWMSWRPQNMYCEPDENTRCLPGDATVYLVVYVSQERGFAVWGEEGWREHDQERREAARKSFRDFCALVDRLIQANAIRSKCFCKTTHHDSPDEL